MRAWRYRTASPDLVSNLHLDTTSIPTPKPNQHLVKVQYLALNPIDYKPAESILGRLLIRKPATPGLDFAGTIIKPAANTPFKSGDPVFGVTGTSPFAGGGLSEYAIAQSENVAPLPAGVSALDASTIPVAALSAYQTIVPRVKKGDSIFINGGSGGTGIFGIQIAKAVGCHVTTSCSTGNVELCKSVGADQVIDYKQGPVADQLIKSGRKYQHVVDNVGNDTSLYWQCHKYTTPDAVYINIAGSPTLKHMYDSATTKFWPGLLGGGQRKKEGFFAKLDQAQLKTIAGWMAEGKVKSVVDSRWRFEEATKAMERLKTGRSKGKVVVEVAP